MKLSDIMSNAGLSTYAQIALVLFLIAFVLIVWWVFRPSARSRWRADKMIPLDDGQNASLPTDPTMKRSSPQARQG
ncbi:MAG: cbb3-type cytochrome oxidase subunit 3 [Gemmatimonadales bacterium]